LSNSEPLLVRDWRQALLAWYDAHGRPLPWRQTRDPYAIWISEIMCQQTQVATAIPYFERWLVRFATVESLAAADEQEVLALWQGLGYYRRARLLLQGAHHIRAYGWPTSRDQWLKVPGVGRYTAGAIASITLAEVVPVVDGNVERV
jgi:A/G-specific adenine glycosylase